MPNNLKYIGGAFIVAGVGLTLLVILALLFQGGAWVLEHIFPWLLTVAMYTFLATLFVSLPLSFIRGSRSVAAVALVVASYIFGAVVFAWSFLLVYALLGKGWAFAGLVFFGFGTIPLALLTTMFKGLWSAFGQLVILLLLTWGIRFYGISVANKADADRAAPPS